MIGFMAPLRVTCLGPRLLDVLREAACWSVFRGVDVMVCQVDELQVPVTSEAYAVAVRAVRMMPASVSLADAESLRAFVATWHPVGADVGREGSIVSVTWLSPEYFAVGRTPLGLVPPQP